MTEAVSPEVTPAAKPTVPAEGTAPFSKGYTRYAMWLLLGIYVINFLDRQVINILAEPIKRDLGLTDTQLGLMSGLAFAVFYTFLGIPIARMAERKNRALIIGTAVGVWSGFTALCATAGNFWQLIIYRIGVGVGEAGCTPPAHSLIADYVPKEKRASALAFYSMGTPIGSLLGLVMGGLIADAYGWRAAFLVAGAPGLIFAVLAIFTLKEPRKIMAQHAQQVASASATFGQTMAYLAKRRTFWFIAFAAAVKAFIGYGHAPFTASFFLRNHAEEIGRLADGFGLGPVGFLGLALGVISGTAGAIGAWVGGVIADRFGRNDLRAYMVTPALASLITIPIYILAVTIDSATTALFILGINAFLGTLWYGPVYGTGQSVVPPHMRATASAILLFVINLVGLGLGPLAVGMLSDYLNTGLGMGPAEGVRWALIISTLFGLAAFACFWLARRTIREDTVS
ncbi:MFS transporter [Phenylobacterium sp. SCN 70-31]|uniref:spinster family MFS transporter n=1 Tax=Phenylobacterium sp. SCN 70-31 TaxID=1660129 RepID=UPI00086947D3|nr:MFS transporter [Phenylobacterium sp. SCN 70-31]ODT88487.1 MAG: MFS transporter [Phenylobacterium sp. SCN 70-31]